MDQSERQLSDNEKQLLAREIAIDKHGYRNYGFQAFTDGWNAGVEWTRPDDSSIQSAATRIIDDFMFSVAVASNHQGHVQRPDDTKVAALIKDYLQGAKCQN